MNIVIFTHNLGNWLIGKVLVGENNSTLIVHGPDPENLVTATIRGGNFYHTFLESRHPGLLEKSSWTCQSGSLMGENTLPWQPGVKFC